MKFLVLAVVLAVTIPIALVMRTEILGQAYSAVTPGGAPTDVPYLEEPTVAASLPSVAALLEGAPEKVDGVRTNNNDDVFGVGTAVDITTVVPGEDIGDPIVAEDAGSVLAELETRGGMSETPKVQIRVKCTNLKKGDTLSESDPMLEVKYTYLGESGESKPGSDETEQLVNEQNPIFAEALSVKSQFFLKQDLKISIYDVDGKKRQYLGGFDVRLGQLLHAESAMPKGELSFDVCKDGDSQEFGSQKGMFNPHGAHPDSVPCQSSGQTSKRSSKPSTCTLYGIDQASGTTKLRVTMSGKDLANTDGVFGKSDPFLQVYGSVKGSSGCKLDDKKQFRFEKGHAVGLSKHAKGCYGPIPIKSSTKQVVDDRSTEAMDNELNPVWAEFEVSLDDLCAGDWTRDIALVVWDSDDGSGDDDIIGGLSMPASHLKDAPSGAIGKLTKGKHKDKSRGSMVLKSLQQVQKITVGQYLADGIEMNVMMAIDLTQSNVFQGDQDAGGLHAIKESAEDLNDYEETLTKIARVLEQYDSDGSIPLWSFGGRHYNDPTDKNPRKTTMRNSYEVVPPDGKLEGWKGPSGLLKGYRQEITRCLAPPGYWYEHTGKLIPCFFGGTNYNEVVEKAAAVAKDAHKRGEHKYFVLVVLTDGDESEDTVQATMHQIAEGALYGLSIVFVGIGNGGTEQFKDIKNLDKQICEKVGYLGDKVVDLTTDFRARQQPGMVAMPPRDIVQAVVYNDAVEQGNLYKQTLEEVPKQMLSYLFDMQKLVPKTAFDNMLPQLRETRFLPGEQKGEDTKSRNSLTSLASMKTLLEEAGIKKVKFSPPQQPSCGEGKGDDDREMIVTLV